MVTRIVSDDKIQITILILIWGALSKPVLFCFKQCYTLCILLTLVTRLTQRFIVYMTQLLLLGKFEYTGGPIFKVVLEC